MDEKPYALIKPLICISPLPCRKSDWQTEPTTMVKAIIAIWISPRNALSLSDQEIIHFMTPIPLRYIQLQEANHCVSDPMYSATKHWYMHSVSKRRMRITRTFQYSRPLPSSNTLKQVGCKCSKVQAHMYVPTYLSYNKQLGAKWQCGWCNLASASASMHSGPKADHKVQMDSWTSADVNRRL